MSLKLVPYKVPDFGYLIGGAGAFLSKELAEEYCKILNDIEDGIEQRDKDKEASNGGLWVQ